MSIQKARTDPDLVVQASVMAVYTGKKRRYAVTYPSKQSVSKSLTKHTSITFSLEQWDGEFPPQCGQLVELRGVVKFKRGWRANAASPITLSDASRSTQQ